MPGWIPLREAIAGKVRSTLWASRSSPSREITITSGATEAIFAAMHAVARAGDEVVLLEPAYDSYEPACELAGARVVRVPLERPDFSVDWDRVRDALSARTRLIIVNSPHNPSGAVFGRRTSTRSPRSSHGSGVFVLGDEVYEHMVFDGAAHASLLRHDGLYARSFVVSSFGKTYHATGWKIGYCIAPAALTERVPQGAPVRAVFGCDAAAGRHRRFPGGVPAAPPRAARVLSAETGLFSRHPGADAARGAPGGGDLLPAGRLLGDQRPPRRRVRARASR